MMNRSLIRLIFASALIPCTTSALAENADWPQWRGTSRNGHAAPQELMQSWPEGGPSVRWSFEDAGVGYSTVAVVDGRLYTLGANEENCFAICLDMKDGSLVWKRDFARASTSDDYNHGWGGGPRSTPTVNGDQVFVLSDVGILAGLDKATGDVQWKTDLVTEHGGKIPVWGYSDSPLVDESRVVVTPGESKFMVAVDRSNGKEVWRSKGVDAPAQYVSIMKGRVGETDYYVTANKEGLVAFDCVRGEKLFSDPTTGNGVAVIPTPILEGNQLYHTSDYGAGNTLLDLSSEGQGSIKADSVYHLNAKTMQNHHGGVVLVEGTIYGFTKANGGAWMAQDMESGETLWDERIKPNKSGSICYADGRLYCYNDKEGTVFLVEPSREGWLRKGDLKIPRQTKIPRNKGAIWAHPIVADQTLIIRDQDLIYAFDIAQ
ncbi:MAG: PQQ-binding-like beta-propeller repeat protein [Rubripirellula sp.]